MEELTLDGEVEDVVRARTWTREVLEAWDEAVRADSELVVSELVGNAFLHGAPPVTLRVGEVEGRVRIEVEDESPQMPIPGKASVEAMTGRGMSLVKGLSSSWGAERRGAGKVVWSEVGGGADSAEEVDVEALLAMFPDLEEGDVTLRVGDVPTALLMASEEHVDNVVREVRLAASGATSGITRRIPALERLARVVEEFSPVRNALRMVGVASSEAGEERTSISLSVPVRMTEVGESFLRGMSEVDAYARSARLLAVETPAEVRAFQEWFVGRLAEGLRRAERGEGGEGESFEAHLLAEVRSLSTASSAGMRSGRLRKIARALTRAEDVDEVAEIVVAEGVGEMAATGGGLFTAEGEGIRSHGAVGYSPNVMEGLDGRARGGESPVSLALSGGEVWIRDKEEMRRRFPSISSVEPSTVSLVAVPLRGVEGVVGALRFSFQEMRSFSEEEREYVQDLAALAASAVERGALFEREHVARERAEKSARRLEWLQELTLRLARTRSLQEVVDAVMRDAAAIRLRAVSLYILEGEMLQLAGSHGAAKSITEKFASIPLHAALPIAEAVCSGRGVFTQSPEERLARWSAFTREDTVPGGTACLPLVADGRTLGGMSLTLEEEWAQDLAEERFLASVAETSAQAVARLGASALAEEAEGKLSFLASVAQLEETDEWEEMLESLARAAVPRMADWCAVHVGQESVVVVHQDPYLQRLAEEYERRWPEVARVEEVARSGVSEIYPFVSNEMREANSVSEEQLAMGQELGIRSAIVVPLEGSRVLGAVTFCYGDTGRRYTAEDLALAEEVGRRAGRIVERAMRQREERGRFLELSQVAQAAQEAILSPVVRREGKVAARSAYLSATQSALVGGDLFEAVEREGALRMIVGDVRGKGLAAVRTTTVVLGFFRTLILECEDLAEVGRRMDALLEPYLGEEDFVTAVIVEVSQEGRLRIASCGHPPVLVVHGEDVEEVKTPLCLPLGLGAEPEVVESMLSEGDRILLYTDGLVERRDEFGEFISLEDAIRPLVLAELDEVLPQVLSHLALVAGGGEDDLALLVAQWGERPA